MGNFISYKDVPVFADFINQDVSFMETMSPTFLFAASDVSINLTPSLTPNRYLGKTQSRNDFSVTGPLEAKVSLTFFPIIERPNPTQSTVRPSFFNQLAFFNTTGNFSTGHSIKISNYLFRRSFLQNYSVKINALQPVSVSANFISYDLDLVSSRIFNETDPTTYSPIARDNTKPHYQVLHGLATTMPTPFLFSDEIPQSKTNIEVNVDCQRTPIYPIGNRHPAEVVLTSLERTTTIQGENIGRAVDVNGSNMGSTDIFFTTLSDSSPASSSNHVLRFDINGRVVSQDLSVSQGNMVNGRVVIKEIFL